MRVIHIPPRQLNVETNLRFSRDSMRFGPPPSHVQVGSEFKIEFSNPKCLTDGGVYCDPAVVRVLVRSVPGFKRTAW